MRAVVRKYLRNKSMRQAITTSACGCLVAVSGCASLNPLASYVNDAGEVCTPTYTQVYQPPLKLGGGGRVIQVRNGEKCALPKPSEATSETNTANSIEIEQKTQLS